MPLSRTVRAKDRLLLWKWVGCVLLAIILFFCFGCQPAPTKIPLITPSALAPTPQPAALPVPISFPKNGYAAPPVEPIQPPGNFYPPEFHDMLQSSGEPPFISSITVAFDGSLWFATDGGVASSGVGVYHFDGATWTHYTQDNGLPFDEISASMVASDGAIWFGTYCCGVTRFDGFSWMTFTDQNGLASNDVRSMAAARDGSLWFGTAGQGVSRYDKNGWRTYTTADGLWGDYVGGIFLLPDGSLLVSNSGSSSARLTRFDGTGWANYPTPWTDQGKYTTAVVTAPNGNLWAATETMGVYRLAEGVWSHYTTQNGLPGDAVHSIVAARDGTIWAGTSNGLSRFDGSRWTTIMLQDDQGNPWVGPIVEGIDWHIWVAHQAGITEIQPNDLRLPQPTPTAFTLPFIDSDIDHTYCDSPPAVRLPAASAQSLSDDEVAKKLMELYLAYFNTPEAPGYCRIDGFTIDKVSDTAAPLEPKGDIMRSVQYSIKLVQMPNSWMCWSGEIDTQNWLHTALSLAIFHTPAGYTMQFAFP
jgi:sugar lactone lactonase YvrE